MKATLTDRRFSDPQWIFERKLDGVRCVAVRDDDAVRLRSRNDLSLDDRYPELPPALAAQAARHYVLDGEVVAFDGARTSFARLAARGRRFTAVYLYAFDLLWLDGQDLRALPLLTRKDLLRQAIDFADPLRYTEHRTTDGEAFYREACAQGWEGLIAKRADSPYASARSRDWLKLKCEQGQELVIGGFTAPQGTRRHLGALLLGHHDDGRLRYAGKVGTGFDRATLADLAERLAARRVSSPPFADPERLPRTPGITWVRPDLVAAVAFTEWTAGGMLRHPRFLGLREDKPAAEVVRER
ncbi:MAG: bifunctional non-ous end joining protein LigD [Solirubrobacteraceae bacterium]|jgi:DNA ligase D-like protein (predicted ligase)|nr:bifunctional non-ous end joining protein LigD [Solirubrobacteraceae bacterium]